MFNIPNLQGSTSQNTKRHHLTPVRTATSRRTNNKRWQGCGGRGAPVLFFFGCSAYRIIVLLPGIKPVPSAGGVQSPNHCAAREAPLCAVDGNANHCSYYGKRCGGSSKKIKHGTTIRSSYSTSGCLFKGYGITASKRYLHPYADCRVTHDPRGMEATRVSTHRWMYKAALL